MKTMLAVLTATLMCGAASATILTFDELPGSLQPIPNGYGGLNWNNMYYLDAVNYWGNPSGYLAGMVSRPNVAYNAYAQTAMAMDGLFYFHGCYLTGAWNDGLNIKVDGYREGNLIYSQTVVVSAYYPTWCVFGYENIDTLVFNSFGGTPVPEYPGGGEHFAMDNMMINEVPEPATMGLLGLGLVGLIARARKK